VVEVLQENPLLQQEDLAIKRTEKTGKQVRKHDAFGFSGSESAEP
jgi:hypothetical protein